MSPWFTKVAEDENVTVNFSQDDILTVPLPLWKNTNTKSGYPIKTCASSHIWNRNRKTIENHSQMNLPNKLIQGREDKKLLRDNKMTVQS